MNLPMSIRDFSAYVYSKARGMPVTQLRRLFDATQRKVIQQNMNNNCA